MAMSGGDAPTYVNLDTEGLMDMGDTIGYQESEIQFAQWMSNNFSALLALPGQLNADAGDADAADPEPSYPAGLAVSGTPIFEYPPAFRSFTGNEAGGGVTTDYQVLDQNGDPMQVAGMVPVEALQQELPLGTGYFGQLGLPTNTSGIFTDQVLGSISPVYTNFGSVINQQIYINYNGVGYPVANITWGVSSTGVYTNVSGTNGVNVSGFSPP